MSKKHGGLSPLLVWVPLLVVNNYSEVKVNIFSNNTGIRKCKKIGGLSPLLVWVPLLIVNKYSEFQVNIFSNNRDIRKCQSFCTKPPPTMAGL